MDYLPSPTTNHYQRKPEHKEVIFESFALLVAVPTPRAPAPCRNCGSSAVSNARVFNKFVFSRQSGALPKEAFDNLLQER